MRQQSPPHQVRIIAGQWRGRRLPVVDEPGLRPTGDRVRETLFNWLAPIIHGGRCLDLFAGTGALGLEALSRGAAEVVFVERSKTALEALRVTTQAWPGIERAEFVQADALAWLKASQRPFDGIFIDPPFDAELHQAALSAVVDRGLLKPGGWLYLEAPKNSASAILAEHPELFVERHKTVGQVDMVLVRYHSGPDST